MRENRHPQHQLVRSEIRANLVSAQGKDFSGQDFSGGPVHGQNFFESIFNGCSFKGTRASQSIFQHAEFTETQFADCIFEDTSFDHSDFVLANIRDSQFVRCSFQNAEWRDTLFDKVTFRQCIFRNTTTSLTRFFDCSFDDSSAANFVGKSKRFSVFSGTHFLLAPEQLEFLRTNFGLTSSERLGAVSVDEDPLFSISLRHYYGILTSADLHRLVMEAFAEIMSSYSSPQLLRMRYLSEICKALVDEHLLSVFAMQFLENTFSRQTATIRDRHHALEVMSLILCLRVAVRESITSITEELTNIPHVLVPELRLRMEFEHTYDRALIVDYVDQMATYCQMSASRIRIEDIRKGSTMIDLLVTGGVYATDIFRFVKYSLSLAAVTVAQVGRLKREYTNLTKSAGRRSKAGKAPRVGASSGTASVVTSKHATLAKRGRPTTQDFGKEIMGIRCEETKPIEVFVDTARQRVLVVDGKVRVTITIG